LDVIVGYDSVRATPTTKRKPASVGEILVEEFMQPTALTQGALAQAMGVQRKHVNELCNDRRGVTAATALILARVFGNSPEFRLTCSGAATCGRRCMRPTRAQADRTGRATDGRGVNFGR
jgi:addiction module HigA family antidote